MALAYDSCQRGKLFFYLRVLTYCPRGVLRLVQFQKNLTCWGDYFIFTYRYRVSRVRTPMGADVILRGDRHHQPGLCCSFGRAGARFLIVRRVFRKERHPNAIFHAPLFTSFHLGSPESNPFTIPS